MESNMSVGLIVFLIAWYVWNFYKRRADKHPAEPQRPAAPDWRTRSEQLERAERATPAYRAARRAEAWARWDLDIKGAAFLIAAAIVAPSIGVPALILGALAWGLFRVPTVLRRKRHLDWARTRIRKL
jgi:hypothetical protein